MNNKAKGNNWGVRNNDNILQLKDVDLKREPKGKKLYLHYCSFCHGANGGGDGLNAWTIQPRPRNFQNAEIMEIKSDRWLFGVISEGGKANGISGSMPPWKHTLKKEQIKELLKYIRTFSKKE